MRKTYAHIQIQIAISSRNNSKWPFAIELYLHRNKRCHLFFSDETENQSILTY